MIQIFSNTSSIVESNAPIPFTTVSKEKGFTARFTTPASITLTRAGIYMVSMNAGVVGAGTIQLFKNGVAQSDAISTASTATDINPLAFITLVKVCNACPCAPTTLQFVNSGAESMTVDNINVVVTKVC